MPIASYVVRRGVAVPFDGSAPPPPPPPPPPSGTGRTMLVGSSRADGKSDKTGLPFPAASVAWHHSRTYQTNAPSSFANSAASGDPAADRSTVFSFNYFNMVSLANGVYDAALITFFKSVPQLTLPSGRPYLFYACPDHEPDVKVNAGTYTTAQYKAGAVHFWQLIRGLRRTNIVTSVITTEQPYYPRAGYTLDSFYDAALCDFVGCDVYNKWTLFPNPPGTPKNQWASVETRFSAFVAEIQARGITRFGITETNCYQPTAAYPQYNKATWLGDGIDYMAAIGAEVFTYWNQAFLSSEKPAGDFSRELDSSQGVLDMSAAKLVQYGQVS